MAAAPSSGISALTQGSNRCPQSSKTFLTPRDNQRVHPVSAAGAQGGSEHSGRAIRSERGGGVCVYAPSQCTHARKFMLEESQLIWNVGFPVEAAVIQSVTGRPWIIHSRFQHNSFRAGSIKLFWGQNSKCIAGVKQVKRGGFHKHSTSTGSQGTGTVWFFFFFVSFFFFFRANISTVNQTMELSLQCWLELGRQRGSCWIAGRSTRVWLLAMTLYLSLTSASFHSPNKSVSQWIRDSQTHRGTAVSTATSELCSHIRWLPQLRYVFAGDASVTPITGLRGATASVAHVPKRLFIGHAGNWN